MLLEGFANLFEWWGLNPLYSRDMADHLRGFDVTCTDYFGSPLYSYVGWFMILSFIAAYLIQYHLINSSAFNKYWHWWIMASVVFILNFFFAFILPFNSLQSGMYCYELVITTEQCLGFGLSSALWGFVGYVLITSLPIFRSFSANCRETTFWKPN